MCTAQWTSPISLYPCEALSTVYCIICRCYLLWLCESAHERSLLHHGPSLAKCGTFALLRRCCSLLTIDYVYGWETVPPFPVAVLSRDLHALNALLAVSESVKCPLPALTMNLSRSVKRQTVLSATLRSLIAPVAYYCSADGSVTLPSKGLAL